VVASQNLGALGPRDGPATQIECPMADSLRSAVGWFVVLLLLVLRKANRVKEAWALLVPLVGLYVALGVAERLLNAYLIFHIHQYLCSALADLLWYLALSLAILLAMADRLEIPWRPVRFGVVFFFLLLCVDAQIALNEWPFLDAERWMFYFARFLLVFLAGNSLVRAVLRRCVRPARFRWWYGGFCLVFGLVPLLTLRAVEAHFSTSVQLMSVFEQYRTAVVLTSAITLPYLLFFAFILLALGSPLYGDRLARAFGLPSLVPEPIGKGGTAGLRD
jgi:hypothetical protein